MGDYPRNLTELEARFSTEAACLEYLAALRWAEGFRCPRCAHTQGWRLETGRIECSQCGRQTSVTAGTLFDRARLPLTVWFRAIWWVTSQKTGASALGLQRVLGLGSYKTAWAWLHKLRRAMVRPGRDRLKGVVEVDETYVGGPRRGKRGRGAGGKTLVVIAAEVEGRRIGRIRLRRVADASSESLHPAVREAVAPGSLIRTDGWQGYQGLEKLGYVRDIVGPVVAQQGENLLPSCHRVASLLKRWLLGTHQGAVTAEHLDYYLDEFTFRFNRRTSRHRGLLFRRLLENAVAIEPVPFARLTKGIRVRRRRNHNI